MSSNNDSKKFAKLFGQLSDTSRSRWSFQRTAVIVLICIFLVLNVYFIGGTVLESQLFFQKIHNDMSQFTSIKWLELKEKYALKSNDPEPQDGAFVFLAMGAQALQMNCPAAVESLVRVAGWKHDVYLLTDRKDCFDEDKIVTNAGMDRDNFHLVSVTDMDLGNGGVDLKHLTSVGFRKQRVLSFSMKTKLFDYIKDERIQRVAYVDCDVIFAIPGCASQFVNSNEGHWETHPLAVTRTILANYTSDEERAKGGNLVGTVPEPIISGGEVGPDTELIDIHLGSFVAHRKHSANIMKVWKQQIEKFTEPGDNDAFMVAYKREDRLRRAKMAHAATGKQMLPLSPMDVREVVMQREDLALGLPEMRYELFYNGVVEVPSCFLHISKARCALHGREHVQDLVNLFNLRTYEHKYPYCTSPLLQGFLYGWFPVAWLPGCPKFEQYL